MCIRDRHNMVNFGPLAAEILSLVWGTQVISTGFASLAALLHGSLVVGVSQTAALNRGRNLYSAGRPSRWAFAHISSFITFCVSRRLRKMYCGHARLCVCLSVPRRIPTLLHGPGCNLGNGRGCPPVVYYWADLQSGHRLRCYGNITRTLVTSLRPSRDMTT